MSCDQSWRVGRRPPCLPPRPQVSAQARPLHRGTVSSRGGGPWGCSGPRLCGLGRLSSLQSRRWRLVSLAASKLEGVLHAFRLLPKLPVLPEVRPLPRPRSLCDPLSPPGPRGLLASACGSGRVVGGAWRGAKSDAQACLSSLLSASPRHTESDPDALALTWTPAWPPDRCWQPTRRLGSSRPESQLCSYMARPW